MMAGLWRSLRGLGLLSTRPNLVLGAGEGIAADLDDADAVLFGEDASVQAGRYVAGAGEVDGRDGGDFLVGSYRAAVSAGDAVAWLLSGNRI